MITGQRHYVVIDVDPAPPRPPESVPEGLEVNLDLARSTLSDDEAADLRLRPGRIVAETMPLRLIEPFDTAGPQPVPEGPTWGVAAVGAVGSPMTGAGISVAVLDTGIEADHPAFRGIDVVEQDFTGGGNGDNHGHGTHCAGTIAGRDIDGTRFGVAPGVPRLLVGKVLGDSGGSTDLIADAILWAVDQGASVISMSLGIDFPGFVAQLIDSGLPAQAATSRALAAYRDNLRLLEALGAYVTAQGRFGNSAILVAAAGNESRREATPPYTIDVAPPAASRGFISVAALGRSEPTQTSSPQDQGLVVASFSNTGANLSGPGVDIISAAVGGGLRSLSGTSMATPHVAGVAALWAQRVRDETGTVDPALLADRVIGTTLPLPSVSFVDGGAGLVQAPTNKVNPA